MFNALIAHPLGRLFQRQPAPAAEPARPALAAAARAQSAFALTQPSHTMPRIADTRKRPAHVAARRPMVAIGGTLAGFEFCVDSPARSRSRAEAGNVRDSALNVLHAMHPVAEAGQVALAEMPASWLAACAADGPALRGMYLVLAPDPQLDDPAALGELVARLRQQGALVGWRVPASRSTRVPPGAPDFLPLTAAARGNADSWRVAIAEAAGRSPDIPLVLLDLASVELLESTFAPPVAMAAFSVGVCDEPPQCEPLPAHAERLLHLLGVAAHDEEGRRLSALLKADPGLHQFVLEGLNAQVALRGRGFVTVERALSVMGRNATHRYLAWMLVQLAPPRAATATLRLHALTRARLTEQLATITGEKQATALYLTGLASVLPTLLRCTVDDALAPLRLPADAINALAEQTGPWMHYVTLIRALERHDMIAAEGLAAPFGGLPAVLAMATEAWQGVA